MTTPIKAPKEEKSSVYVTGHCGNGAHERSKILSTKGSLLQACRGTYEYHIGHRTIVIKCTCFCHEMFAALLAEDPDALAGVDTDAPIPVSPAPVDPVPLEPLAGLPLPGGPVAPDKHKVYRRLLHSGTISSQLGDMVRKKVLGMPEDLAEVHADLDKGRRKRGELEANVEVVCKLWLDGHMAFPDLTTDILGLLIDANDTPSQGAIHAVLTRWETANLAVIGHKPMRFLSFPSNVIENGIAHEKGKASREAEKRAKGFF